MLLIAVFSSGVHRLRCLAVQIFYFLSKKRERGGGGGGALEEYKSLNTSDFTVKATSWMAGNTIEISISFGPPLHVFPLLKDITSKRQEIYMVSLCLAHVVLWRFGEGT